MKKSQIYYVLLILLIVIPNISFAALSGIAALITSFGGLVNPIIRILFGISLIFFFWGIGQFILKAGDAKAREEGKQKILWGVIAIFVFMSIFGIIEFIGATLNIPVGEDINFGVF